MKAFVTCNLQKLKDF